MGDAPSLYGILTLALEGEGEEFPETDAYDEDIEDDV